jgi:hypothetical protein
MSQSKWVAQALEAVNGDRQEQYGTPEEQHGCVAQMWEAYLERVRRRDDPTLQPSDVCAMNILQKMAREATGEAGEDSWIDTIGYSLNVEMMREPAVSGKPHSTDIQPEVAGKRPKLPISSHNCPNASTGKPLSQVFADEERQADDHAPALSQADLDVIREVISDLKRRAEL